MAGKRRRGGKEVSQKGKNRHRPREWRRGRAQGRRNDKIMQAEVEPAYARAERDRVEVERAASEHRELVRDFEELLASYARAPASVALGPLPACLL